MNILENVFAWSRGLHQWQQDALRRILEKGSLTSIDLDDLKAIAKLGAGIPDRKGRKAVPLQEGQIPVGGKTGQSVSLKAIRNLENVNAIYAGQRLEFEEKGLTVVYGDNGSGKSGYVRVLKRACRARDQEERVLPNVFASTSTGSAPEAELLLNVSGAERTEKWREGGPAADILSAVSIFDSRCARVYIDDANDVAYIPYGLDVLLELARVSQLIRDKLEEDRNANAVDLEVFRHLVNESEAGQFVATLSHDSDTNRLERLATVTKAEKARVEELRKNLKEGNPSGKIEALRLLDKRLERIETISADLARSLSEKVLRECRDLWSNWIAARQAAELAKSSAFERARTLPGTGGEEWRQLFLAAKEFSERQAYPKRKFPFIGSGAQCVLCQQELTSGAVNLEAFQKFLEQDSEKTLAARNKEVEAKLEALLELENVRALADAETRIEIVRVNKDLAKTLKEFEVATGKRHAAAIALLRTGKCPDPPPLPDFQSQLRKARAEISRQISELQRLVRGDTRKKVEDEALALESRLALSKQYQALKRAISRLQMQFKLNECLKTTTTTAISRKVTELNEQAVSSALEGLLNSEFAALGASHLRMKVERRTVRGKSLHKLRLDVNAPSNLPLSSILSEGEQRVIAIGSFLAEVNLGGGASAIVFDDPVSSLDHARRELVAARLVRESEMRQVIVFTHDLYFLFVLLDTAIRRGVNHLVSSIQRWGDKIGLAKPDIPFRGKSVKDRVSELKVMHSSAERLHTSGDLASYETAVRDGYRQLRESWERAVEEVLLGGVVQRFKQGLETQKLHSVVVDDLDYKDVNDGMARCSSYLHDQAVTANPPMPSPAEFREDIERLESFRVRVVQRTEAIAKKRRAMTTMSR